MRISRSCLLALIFAALCLPGLAQSQAAYTFFGGTLLGSPSGFTLGAGLNFPLISNLSFAPSVAVGHTGNSGLFTADGVAEYSFATPGGVVIPYVLGGVGMSHWASATHGSLIAGGGARFAIGHGMWVVPEVRAATHGLARFTIGISKSF